MRLAVGSRLGPYEIVAPLGAGGMGEVYKARDTRLERLVAIHDISDEGDIHFLVMEYVPGKTLEQIVPRKGLRLSDTLKYAVQIADALATAHSAAIIHRDVKPSNIMVTDQGRVKVLDFGLAKLTEPAEVSPDQPTRTALAHT